MNIKNQSYIYIDKIVKAARCHDQTGQERGETEPVDARMLLLDIISLNIFPFIGFHIIEPIFDDLSGNRERFFEMRRAENVEIILRRLKKA